MGGPACPPIGHTALQRERADTQVRPYTGLHVKVICRYSSSASLAFELRKQIATRLAIVLIQLSVRDPKTIPLLELFSSKGGTFRFLRGNSQIPTEGRNDLHVDVLKYPGGEFLFSTWGRKNSSEESNETSEEMNHAHVENKKYPRGDLRFPTWIFEKGG